MNTQTAWDLMNQTNQCLAASIKIRTLHKPHQVIIRQHWNLHLHPRLCSHTITFSIFENIQQTSLCGSFGISIFYAHTRSHANYWLQLNARVWKTSIIRRLGLARHSNLPFWEHTHTHTHISLRILYLMGAPPPYRTSITRA